MDSRSDLHRRMPFWQRFTLRQRVTLSTAGVLFVLGVLLILFVNNLSPIFVSRSAQSLDTFVLVESTDAFGEPTQVWARTPAPDQRTIALDPGFIRSNPSTWINAFSIVGLVLIILLGIFGAQWVANTALLPVEQISQAAHQIQAKNLNQRINYQGAQDEVKVLADSFDGMLQRLETNFKEQGEFTSNLAHELRTPLATLHLNLEMLNSDPYTGLESYQVFARQAEGCLNRLEQLVQDLLLLSRGEKELARELIYPQVMVEEIFAEMALPAHQKGVELWMKGDGVQPIYGDPVLLQQAITNLIQNGIRYNHLDGFVEVSIGSNPTTCTIRVRDDGKGIDPEELPHIFERFYRDKYARKENPDGTGLGLAISAHIIRLHGGRIEVASQPGEGCTFSVYLPVASNFPK